MTPSLDALVARIVDAPKRGTRKLIGLAGPPASGKSTLAAQLATVLGGEVVPMDGFHLSNEVLQARGLVPRKGAPQTFDAEGFAALVSRLGDSGDVPYPTFDRDSDAVIEGGGVVLASCGTVIVEGNYLLLDQMPWVSLREAFDLTIFLKVPDEILRERLLQRWRDQGLAEDAAVARAYGNDIPNAETVNVRSLRAEIVVSNT